MIGRIPIDLHTHTFMSGHAYGTIREMAQGAKERGISILGIAEHGPGIPGTCEPIYYSNLAVAPRVIYGVHMLYGCEINVLNDGTLSLKKYIDKLDYALVGIHKQCYENAGRDGNTENLLSCMRHQMVRFVSHPDDDHTPLDLECLVRGARDMNVALEINNSSFTKPHKRLNCVENYRTMLALCRRYDVPVLVSSDAHTPEHVGRFDLAIRMLNEMAFPQELIVNRAWEPLAAFLGLPVELAEG